MNFDERVRPRDLPELMDGVCTYEEFRACLESLEQVNRWFLGYRPTLAWLDRLQLDASTPVHIVDVGSGGGDLLRRIGAWAKQRQLTVHLTGIDLNPFATRAALEFTESPLAIEWKTMNAFEYTPDRSIDIVVSSLMTHHLEDDDIVAFIEWMEKTAKRGWFINDLERSKQSYLMFGWIAKAMKWHHFVQHDGPVSFRRALSRKDWYRLLAVAGIGRSQATVESWRPGRLCVGRVTR